MSLPILSYLETSFKKKKKQQERRHKTKQGDLLVHIKAKTPKGNDEGMKGAWVQRNGGSEVIKKLRGGSKEVIKKKKAARSDKNSK